MSDTKGRVQVGRPSFLYLDAEALRHNLAIVKRYAPQQAIIAMVKANAYGCGVQWVAPLIESNVFGFGVACLEEAIAVRQVCMQAECLLMHGIFSPDELTVLQDLHLSTVIHNSQQLVWLTTIPVSKSIKVWVKVDTVIHRFGFQPHELTDVLAALRHCPWIDATIGLMTHLACADTPLRPDCQQQIQTWESVAKQYPDMPQSVANSAAIMALPQTHANVVRPGLMLYGASPFADRLGCEFGLQPVMHFISEVTTIHHYAVGEAIGYGATWRCSRPSVIGVIPVGYGDGYPRHIKRGAQVWVKGRAVPIVGRISMDMMTIDVTDCSNVQIGDQVELWGKHLPIETVAQQAGTIAYELMTQVSQRVVRQYTDPYEFSAF